MCSAASTEWASFEHCQLVKEFPRFMRRVRLESLTVPGGEQSWLRLLAGFSVACTEPGQPAAEQNISEPFARHGSNLVAVADSD